MESARKRTSGSTAEKLHIAQIVLDVGFVVSRKFVQQNCTRQYQKELWVMGVPGL